MLHFFLLAHSCIFEISVAKLLPFNDQKHIQNVSICALARSTNLSEIFSDLDWRCNYLGTEPLLNPCTWSGVSCNKSEIVSISLPRNSVVGVLPSLIGDLKSLRYLNLNGNSLYSMIPVSYTHLTLPTIYSV